MTDSNRGTCRVCGGDFQLTANGRIRSHGPREARCAGGSDMPVSEMFPALQEDTDPEPKGDLRPTASEFREAQSVLLADWSDGPGSLPVQVLSGAKATVSRATEYGTRPDQDQDPEQHSSTTVAANGTPMTVHGGPNPHRAPLPTGNLPADSFGPAPVDNPVVIGYSFDSAAPVSPPKVQADTAPHRVRKGPEKDDFDRWGRYKLPDPRTGETKGRQRVTTFAKMISDQYGLSRWQQRMLLKGAVENPQIVQQARGLDVKVNAATMDTVADALKDLAGDKVAAALGTEFHALTEEYDLGRLTDLSQAPERHRGALVSYTETMRAAGLVSPPEFVERTTMVRSVDVAGTLDRILGLPNGDHVIGDVKTGQDLTYGWLDIGVQLACYAHGVNENGVWDWETRQWIPAPKVRTDYAIVMHAPAGSNICVLYRVDLAVGWANATLAAQVREARKYRRHSQLLAMDGPEFVPSPGATAALEAAQGAVQSFGNAGVPMPPAPGSDAYLAADDAAETANRQQADATFRVQPHTAVHVPTLRPQLPEPTPEPGGRNLLMKMELILDTDDAAKIYAEAVQTGAGPEELAGLSQVGMDRLMRVAQAREAFSAVRTRQQAGELYNTAVGTFGEYDPIIPALVATATATLDALNSPPF